MTRNSPASLLWLLCWGGAALVGLLEGSTVASAAADLSQLPAAASRPVDFVKDIQPIFEASCVSCHGPDKQKGGLRLDRKSDAFAAGDEHAPNIHVGNGAESPLVVAVSLLNDDFTMPAKGDPLTPEQVGLLRAWIDQGAAWPDDGSRAADRIPWSFAPLTHPSVPPVADAFAARCRTPVDRFVLAKLAEKNLTLSPEADRRNLIRRLAFVLTGLPPTPEQVDAFVQSEDPLAFEKLVDEMIGSPHFGERWAQYWLDVVRFAETNGSESNLYRKNAWPYRDYVIRAFNNDLPLNRFIHEQIAGDIDGVDEATTFLVSGMYVAPATVGREEQAIRQARADRLDETIQSVSASLLGVTMACARCHNHKFDPIPQKDYYALAAIFQGVEYGHRPWSNMPGSAERSQRATELLTQLITARKELSAITPVWTEEWPSSLQTHFAAVKTKTLRITFPVQGAGVVDELEVYGAPTGEKNLALAENGGQARAYKTGIDPTRQIANIIDGRYGPAFGWTLRGTEDLGKKTEAPWFEIELPTEASVDHIIISSDRETLELTSYLLDRASTGPRKFRIETRGGSGEWQRVADVNLLSVVSAGGQRAAKRLAALTKREGADPKLTPATAAIASDEADAAISPKENLSVEVRERLQKINQLARQLVDVSPQPLFAGYFIPPVKTYLFGRGDPMNPREEVVPNALTALQADLHLTSTSSDHERRLAFAEWLTDPAKNPLTPRVLANRLWLHVFGKGIVETPADFGKAGGSPSNPELLDWLTQEFVSSGWSAKKMIRLMVMSSAFRQSSAPNEAAARVDADARWLWRFPPRRVEAEVLRDATLLVSGTLDSTMGGPGFRIHGDKLRYESWQVIDNAGPTTWRRMIYQERMRGIDDRMFTAFDRPECGQVTPTRTISTTPLQALNLLNGPFIVTQSGKFAERIRREAGTDVLAQVRRAFALAFDRKPTRAEEKGACSLVQSDGLPALCRALLNANEFAYIE